MRRDDDVDVGRSERPAGHDVRQALAVVLGPFAVLGHLQLEYLLVQVWACKSAWSPVVLHGVTLLMLALALLGGALALVEWRRAGDASARDGHAPLTRWDPGDHGGRAGRSRVMAAMGLGISALSVWIIVAMWLPHLVLGPCQQ